MFFLRACLGAVWARSALPGFVVVRGGFRSAFGRQILRRSAAGRCFRSASGFRSLAALLPFGVVAGLLSSGLIWLFFRSASVVAFRFAAPASVFRSWLS